jgi:hypothetical protein
MNLIHTRDINNTNVKRTFFTNWPNKRKPTNKIGYENSTNNMLNMFISLFLTHFHIYFTLQYTQIIETQ